jgi:hypothetical protein
MRRPSHYNFNWTMTANITTLSLVNFRACGIFKVFITGHSTTAYTIATGGSGGLGTGIYTNWSATQTINANSRSIINIDYDGTSYYLTGTFNLTG